MVILTYHQIGINDSILKIFPEVDDLLDKLETLHKKIANRQYFNSNLSLEPMSNLTG